MTQEKAIVTWAGGPKFDTEVLRELTLLLKVTDLAPDTGTLPAQARALANRRFLEQAFTPAFRPLAPATVSVLDIATGKITRSWPVPLGGAIKAVNAQLVYVVSGGTDILSLDPQTGKTRKLVKGLQNARGITVDAAGKIYVSVGEPDMQVLVFNPNGKEISRIGRKGGRAPVGSWQADGLLYPAGVAVDREGKLWVTERDAHPKRVSVWNLADAHSTGSGQAKLVTDFFGPTQYGASGSAINPRDPNVMVGVGCEWRLDPKTGKSVCLGAFDRQYHSFATYREGKNGRQYLFTDYGHAGSDGVQGTSGRCELCAAGCSAG